MKCPSRRPPTAGSWVLVPPRPEEEVLFNVFEPKLVDSLLYAMIEFFNHGIQGTATWSQLSLVPLHTVGHSERGSLSFLRNPKTGWPNLA